MVKCTVYIVQADAFYNRQVQPKIRIRKSHKTDQASNKNNVINSVEGWLSQIAHIIDNEHGWLFTACQLSGDERYGDDMMYSHHGGMSVQISKPMYPTKQMLTLKSW